MENKKSETFVNVEEKSTRQWLDVRYTYTCGVVCVTVPEGVEAPKLVDSGPTYLVLEWQLPMLVNGLFTGFNLLQSPGINVYSGALTSFNVTNLNVRTLLLLYLIRLTLYPRAGGGGVVVVQA